MNLTHVLQSLGFPEEEVPALLDEAESYDPALLEQAFSDEAMQNLSSGAARKMLNAGLSSSFVFHLAVWNPLLLAQCPPLEIFHTVLGSDWVDILNENHTRHVFGDERVYDLLDRLVAEHLTNDIKDLCDAILDELSNDECE